MFQGRVPLSLRSSNFWGSDPTAGEENSQPSDAGKGPLKGLAGGTKEITCAWTASQRGLQPGSPHLPYFEFLRYPASSGSGEFWSSCHTHWHTTDSVPLISLLDQARPCTFLLTQVFVCPGALCLSPPASSKGRCDVGLFLHYGKSPKKPWSR